MEIFDTTNLHGVIKDLSSDHYASELIYFNGEALKLQNQATYFGYVIEGEVSLFYLGNEYTLTRGMYFSVPQDLDLDLSSKRTTSGKAIICSKLNYQGFFSLGGPVEEKGRLRYIDGCTDSLLISPVMLGEPCLNLLHIPKNTQQSQHTHPSLRLGVIISGEGICKTPEKDYALTVGTVFYIPQDGKHSFHTHSQDLRVIAYHPESDFGPTHENHPMVNKTIL